MLSSAYIDILISFTTKINSVEVLFKVLSRNTNTLYEYIFSHLANLQEQRIHSIFTANLIQSIVQVVKHRRLLLHVRNAEIWTVFRLKLYRTWSAAGVAHISREFGLTATLSALLAGTSHFGPPKGRRLSK